jgi:hypothetical protein
MHCYDKLSRIQRKSALMHARTMIAPKQLWRASVERATSGLPRKFGVARSYLARHIPHVARTADARYIRDVARSHHARHSSLLQLLTVASTPVGATALAYAC